MPQPTENMTVRLPANVQKRLDKIAVGMDRSRNWLVNRAIEQYLEAHDWQVEKIRDRLSFAESGGEFVPHDEAMERLEAKLRKRRKS